MNLHDIEFLATKRFILEFLLCAIKDYLYEPKEECSNASCSTCPLFNDVPENSYFLPELELFVTEEDNTCSALPCKFNYRTAKHFLYEEGKVYFGQKEISLEEICIFLEINKVQLQKYIIEKPNLIIKQLRKIREQLDHGQNDNNRNINEYY